MVIYMRSLLQNSTCTIMQWQTTSFSLSPVVDTGKAESRCPSAKATLLATVLSCPNEVVLIPVRGKSAASRLASPTIVQPERGPALIMFQVGPPKDPQ